MKYLILMLAFLSGSAFAGDKVGNGGGLWVCFDANKEVQIATLVDFYEAENEMGLTLARPTSENQLEIANLLAGSLLQTFPNYALRWNTVLATVKARIFYTTGELEIIKDAFPRQKPAPSLCRNGWQPVQFANYNDTLQRVLIQKDYWESAKVTALDKAGLIWHEVIYRWLREEFDEQDSVRARQIVAVLFSTLPAHEQRTAIEGILKQGSNEPRPEQPVFVCLIKNQNTSRFFSDYGTSELAARNQSLKTCQVASGQEAFHCVEHQVRCDSFTSMRPRFTCSNRNQLTFQVYTETGRSMLEAEAKARVACTNAPEAFHCEPRVTCN